MRVLVLATFPRQPDNRQLWEGLRDFADVDIHYCSKQEQKDLGALLRRFDFASYDRVICDLLFRYLSRQWRLLSQIQGLLIYEEDACQEFIESSRWRGKFSQFYRKVPNARVVMTGFQVCNKFLAMGVSAHFLPKGVDTEKLYDAGLDRDIPLGFVGRLGSDTYQQRRELLLRAQHELGVQILRSPPGDDYRNLLNRIRFFVSADIGLGEYMAKNFEAMACGCVLVAFRQGGGEEEALGLESGINFLSFSSHEELKSVIETSIDVDQIDLISSNGRSLVLERYDYRAQSSSIFDILNFLFPSVPKRERRMGEGFMGKNILSLFNGFFVRRRLRRVSRKKGGFGIRVRSVCRFFEDLDAHGLCYLVLRWSDNIFLGVVSRDVSKDEADERWGDVDLLIDLSGNRISSFIAVVSRHICSSGIRLEFYSSVGLRGFTYRGLPYYPPALARKMLHERVWDDRGFYRLSGELYILSLVYHLIYHKAASFGFDGFSVGDKVEPYLERLSTEALLSQVKLPSSLALESLYGWLVDHKFDMPYDLKVRWPLKSDFLDRLIALDEAAFPDIPGEYGYLGVFVLRDDLESAELLDCAVSMIARDFVVREKIYIPLDKRPELAARLRGGTWVEGERAADILPCMVLFCDDLNRRAPFSVDDKYPYLDNLNMLNKHKYREELADISGVKMYGVHASDNLLEARYMLKVVAEVCGEG